MRRLDNRKILVILGVGLLVASLIMGFVSVPMAQTTPQIVAYKISGSANLSAPGTESFWSKIPWDNISLTANIPQAPTSGITHYVLVKTAWNGTDLMVLMSWPAPDPAFGAWSAAAAAKYPAASGPGVEQLQELTPGTTYYINTSYSNYVTFINGTQENGRLVLNYSGITLPMLNGTQIWVLPNGIIITPDSLPKQYLLYNHGMFYGYYVNATQYYPDRAAIMWYMGSVIPPTTDCMNLGGDYIGETLSGYTFTTAGGSLQQQGGAANIWMWVSGATWNNKTYDPAFAANLWNNESLTGLPYTDPGNQGFAVPLYTNNTNMYEVDTAGIWYAPVASSGLNGSLFFVKTGATYSNGFWTVEYVRPLQVPQAYAQWMPNFTVGNTYYVAFAVWQGKLGETLFDKSITSGFLQFTLSNSAPTTTSSTTTTSTTTTTSNTTSTTIPSNGNGVALDATIIGAVVAIIVLVSLYVVFRRQ
ncbi:MAG: cytochrome b558/566 subunit A [Metallosphaera sp.]|uniref:cytochrome b558/566 subunit A n=1 Tax=unclassified Metallosphaera TaxID=2633810 RepID=UPI00315EEE23